jgi:coenzyme F420 biosynthesis associated uncharacterized protein
MASMPVAAEKLVDWRTARVVGEQIAGKGAPLTAVQRARLLEDFGDVVPEAESLARDFTGLAGGQYRARPWVMTRSQWLQANLRGFERILEPFAEKVMAQRSNGALSGIRRNVLAAQVGGLLGYLGHRVLGQYDLFLPPDDDGLIYFVGPNVAGVERKFGFRPREFRLWLSLHEVAHKVQFAAAPWLRGYLLGLMDSYLGTVEIDPGMLAQSLKRAIDEVRSGTANYRGFGWIFLLMTPEQREMVRQMQAMMSLLEGHGNFVMEEVSRGRIPGADAFRRTLHQRRSKAGVEKAFQKAIGFDVKTRQYEQGERFVSDVVRQAGLQTFNRVWEAPANLPTMEEIARPQDWVARVAAS